MSLIANTDINIILYKLLDIQDLINLLKSNKFYYNQIINTKKYQAEKFYKNKYYNSYIGYGFIGNNIEKKFQLACLFSTLDVVVYTWENYGKNINIRKYFNRIFSYACDRAQPNIAQYILKISNQFKIDFKLEINNLTNIKKNLDLLLNHKN